MATNGKKGFTHRLTNKALPAALGGVGTKIVNKYITPQVGKMLPESFAPITDLTPAIIGVFLLDNKDERVQFAAAGMIGAGSSETLAGFIPGLNGIDEEVLADELDELLSDELADDDEEEDNY